jgi:seryl-tRNA synthetase
MQEQKTPSMTLEEAHHRLAELEHAHKNAVEERDRHRRKLSKYEEAEKNAREASMSEVERVTTQFNELKAQHAALVQQYQQMLVTIDIERRARTLGIRDDAVQDVAKLLDQTQIERDDDGHPKNIPQLLETLVKQKPYLTVQQQTEEKNAGIPSLPALNPGRTSIAAPGMKQPGKIPRLTEVYTRPT